jgi:flagella basal body P-ring formation protein FlgA
MSVRSAPLRRASFGLAAALAATAPLAAHADTVRVRETVSVAGGMVTLGDLFRGIPKAKQDREVVRAPEPGRSRRVSSSLMNRIAEDNGIAWHTADSGVIAKVHRKSHEIGRARVKAAVRRALAARDVSDELRIELSNPNLDLVIPTTVPKTVRLEDFTYRRNSGRFSARAHAPADGQSHTRATITGEAVRMVRVPVLKRRVDRNERGREDDIRWVERRQDDIRSNTVTDADTLVGNIARRPLASNELLRDTAIEEPILVEDRSLVTIKLRTDSMNLTAKGRAKEDGAKGDTVRVENVQSKKTITGVVIGSGVVAVKPNGVPTN